MQLGEVLILFSVLLLTLAEGQNTSYANDFETLQKACYKQVAKIHSTNQDSHQQPLLQSRTHFWMQTAISHVKKQQQKNMVMEFHDLNPNYLPVNVSILR